MGEGFVKQVGFNPGLKVFCVNGRVLQRWKTGRRLNSINRCQVIMTPWTVRRHHRRRWPLVRQMYQQRQQDAVDSATSSSSTVTTGPLDVPACNTTTTVHDVQQDGGSTSLDAANCQSQGDRQAAVVRENSERWVVVNSYSQLYRLITHF